MSQYFWNEILLINQATKKVKDAGYDQTKIIFGHPLNCLPDQLAVCLGSADRTAGNPEKNNTACVPESLVDFKSMIDTGYPNKKGPYYKLKL